MITLLALLTAPVADAQTHPLAACETKRGAIPYNTTVTFFCGTSQLATRRYGAEGTVEVRIEAFRGEMALVAEAIEAELTWNPATVSMAGASRRVAQYTLKNDGGVLRTGLVVPGNAATDLMECSSSDADGVSACPELVAALLLGGLPSGVDYLPLATELRRATVLGKTIKVIPGCKAQWVFDEAVHVVCADGELVFGSKAELSADGMGADPIAALHEQVGGASAGKEAACTVGGASTRCWTADVKDGGVPMRIVTARPTLAGKESVVACTYTALGAEVHPLCAQLLGP